MDEPDISKIIKELEDLSNQLLGNSQYGNSKLMLAIAKLVSVMGWSSHQQDQYSKKLIRLTWGIIGLTILMLVGLVIQIALAFK